MEHKIDLANDSLHEHFGDDWLNETLGQSKITPIHLGGRPEIWYHFITDARNRPIDADIGFITTKWK